MPDVLTGRITDLSGRPVADAQVGATQLGSGRSRTNVTDEEGRYRITFPQSGGNYQLIAKRLGFSPVQRTVSRRTPLENEIVTDIQFGGPPLALSMVEVTAESANGFDAPEVEPESSPRVDATVPNPVADILALADSLHLSAVQIIGLRDLSDSLRTRNTALLAGIRTYIQQQKGRGQEEMAKAILQMLNESLVNSNTAVASAQSLLTPEQWVRLPQSIRQRPDGTSDPLR